METPANGGRLKAPSMDHLHLGPEVCTLSFPAIGPSTFGGAAGRGAARGSVATSPSWPLGPLEEFAVTARSTTSEAVSAAIPRRPRATVVKKPSASPRGSALLQRPPSHSSIPTASISPMASSSDKAIAMMVTVMLGPRAGSHTPATEGKSYAGVSRSPTSGEGAADMRTAPCRLPRSHRPASWTTPPLGLCLARLSTCPWPRCISSHRADDTVGEGPLPSANPRIRGGFVAPGPNVQFPRATWP